jgi:Zn-dependent protease with chaperone function
LNETAQGFDACLIHPSLGNEVVEGKIFVDYDALSFHSETTSLEIPIEELIVSLGKGKDEQIYFSDQRRPNLKCFTTDSSVLDCRPLAQSHRVRRQLETILSRREILRRLRVTACFFIAFVLAAWLVSLAAGFMVHSLVNEIPADVETKFGDSLIKKLQNKITFVNDTNTIAQLTALAAPLIRTIPSKGIQFKFHIMEDEFPNAFALPGGHIVISTGMLQMADRPEELLGVIAHEAAHITQKHAFRHLISGKGPVFILQIFMGSRNRLLDVMAYPSEKLVYESFSQEYEKEADSVGWNYLVAANINPHGMIDIFNKLKNYEGRLNISEEGSAYASHPALRRRIGWLEEKWNKLPRKTGFLEITNAVPKIQNESSTRF